MTVCKRISLHENSHFQSSLEVCCWWFFSGENDTSIWSSSEENLWCSRVQKIVPLLKVPRQQGQEEPSFGCVNSTCSIPWYQPDLCDDFPKRDNYVDWDYLFTQPCHIWNETRAPDLLKFPCTADVEVPCQNLYMCLSHSLSLEVKGHCSGMNHSNQGSVYPRSLLSSEPVCTAARSWQQQPRRFYG